MLRLAPLGFLGLSLPSLAEEIDCLRISIAEVAQELVHAYDGARSLSPALVQGVQIPQWNDFNNLRVIIANVRAGKTVAASSGKLAELDRLIALVAESVPLDSKLRTLRDASRSAAIDPSKYVPTEFELKREYQSLLWELNRELPTSLKIPGVRVPRDERKSELLRRAREIVRRQEGEFATLIPTTGFASVAEVDQATQALSPEAQKVWSMIHQENIQAVMRRPENARFWVTRVGFHNQRVTGSSREHTIR